MRIVGAEVVSAAIEAPVPRKPNATTASGETPAPVLLPASPGGPDEGRVPGDRIRQLKRMRS